MTPIFAALPMNAIDGTLAAVRLLSCATLIWLFAAATTWTLRRSSSAAVRHRIWSLSCQAALALPVLIQTMPQWRVGPRLAAVVSAAAVGPTKVLPPPGPSAAYAQNDLTPPYAESVVPRLELPESEQPASSASAAHPVVARAVDQKSGNPTLVNSPSMTIVRRPIPWSSICQISWVTLAAWLIVRQIASIRAAQVLVRNAAPIDPHDRDAVGTLNRIARQFGVAAPAISETDQISSPICVGLFRPSVLLPVTWRDWSASDLETVLAHELAHIARRDVPWQTLARFTAALYWFNPLVWIAVWRMRVERELACDDWVLRQGQPSTTYARCLLDVAAIAMRRRPHLAQAAAVAMAARGGLERRLVAILDPARRRSPLSRRAAVVLSLSAAVLAIAIGVINPWAPRAVAAGPIAAKAATAPSPAVSDPNDRVLNLTGRVEDQQGRPIAGVYLQIHSGLINQQLQSGADGRFATILRQRRDSMRYVNVRATTLDGALQTFRQLYDPKGDGHITDDEARDVRLGLRPAREFPVTVVDGQQQPVADAWVAFSAFYMKAGEAKTDAQGKAILRVPADAPSMNAMATKPGVGLVDVSFWRPEQARTDPYRLPPEYAGPLNFVLDGAKTVTVKVLDEADQPLPNVRVRPWFFVKPKRGGNFNQSITELARTTNAQGLATFDYIPADLSSSLVLWTFLDGYSSPQRCAYEPSVGKTDLETTMLRRVHIAGRVLDDNGRPVAGATVRYSGDGYGLDPCFGTLETLADGTFAAMLDADMYYMFAADKDHLVARPLMRMVRRASPAPIELALKPGTRIFGRATLNDKGAPMPHASISLLLRDENSYARLAPDEQLLAPAAVGEQSPKTISPHLNRTVTVDAKGAFEVYAAPGKYTLSAYGEPRISASAEAKVTTQDPLEINLRAQGEMAVRKTLRGRVVRRDKPEIGVPFVTVTGQSMKFDVNPIVISDKEGNFEIEHGNEDLYLFAESEDKALRGMATIHANDGNITISVGSTASVTGRLLDHNGMVAGGRDVQSSIHIGPPAGPSTESFFNKAVTDVDGTFTIDGLVPGCEYQLRARTNKIEGQPQTLTNIGTVKADQPGQIDLGDRKLPRPYVANQAKSWKERETEAFAPLDPIEQRLIEARERARAARLRVLVVLGCPGRPGCDEFFEFASDLAHFDVRRALADYTIVAVDTLLTEPDAAAWVERADVPWPAKAMTLAVLDPDGKVISQSALKPLSVDGKLDRKRLIEFLSRAAPEKPIAQPLVDAAALKSTDVNVDPARTGFQPALKLPALNAVSWRILAEPMLNGGRLHWPGMTDPIAAGGVVYFGDDNGAVRAVRSRDGAQLWAHEHGERVYTPFVDEDCVYFTSKTGLAAIQRSDGKPAWQFDIEGGASESGGVVWPATNTLFCSGEDGFLYALDRHTGKPRWKHSLIADRPADPKGFDGGRARIGKAPARPTGVATDGKTVFQSVFDQSRVVAVDCATGQRSWAFQAGGWIHGSPAVNDQHVFVGSQDRSLYCLDKATGKQVWSFHTQSRIESTPSLADGKVYVPSCDGALYCIDEATGQQVWAFATDPGPNRMHAIYSTPLLTADAVYFAAGEGQIYALDRATGQLIWKLRPSESSELFCSLATDGTRLFVTTRATLDQSGETSLIAVGP
jgi:outer membrane protein assembly factor BamB/beta-lactamase regulating signal transducer with metallopeptidase domain